MLKIKATVYQFDRRLHISTPKMLSEEKSSPQLSVLTIRGTLGLLSFVSLFVNESDRIYDTRKPIEMSHAVKEVFGIYSLLSSNMSYM